MTSTTHEGKVLLTQTPGKLTDSLSKNIKEIYFTLFLNSSDDSSSDSSDEEGADAAENKFEKWGELDQDAERTDESTNRYPSLL